MKITLIIVFGIAFLTSAQINWFTVGDGANGQINDVASDSSGIYFVGGFTQIAGIQAKAIAKWNGVQWETFSNNFSSLNAIALSKNDIYVGGSTENLTGIFKWSGSTWDTIGVIPFGNITTITFDDSNLYAGGFFNSISGVTAFSAARWDGNQWHQMGNDFQAEIIHSLIIYKNQLYAGGTFIRASKNLFHIARWQDTSWVSVNGGANLPVKSMYAYNDTLYVAGQFSQVGNFSGGSGIPANRIARWDGNNWSAIGQGLEGIPEDLIVRNNYIYVAGNLSGANPPFEVIYKYDGLNWNLLATANGSFTDISFFESENSFYIGGNFSSVSTLGTANNLVRFVDSSAIITSIKNTDEIIIPSEFVLSQNYPNPFNPSTKISWQSPVSGHQTLKVYDILGNEVATLVDEYREAGRYEIEFNAEVGSLQMASGVYYYQLRVGDTSTGSGQSFISTKKMIYLK